MKLRRTNWLTTRITIETHRVMVVRRQRVVRFWCGECGGESEFVPVEDLNGSLEDGADGGDRRALNTELHFAKARNGVALVCIKSLTRTS